jgi:hypothetical protein
MPNNLPSINLVKDKQIPLFDKFTNWVLTVGRLIVIITEIVAVIAFIYRFSLDEKLVNLHSAIKQKQNIVSILRNDESKYRNLQDRIALAASFSEKGAKASQAITDIISLIPSQTIVNNLIINKDKATININTSSVLSLADFINSLKNYNGIKSISIDNIENKPSVGLSVSVTTTLK